MHRAAAWAIFAITVAAGAAWMALFGAPPAYPLVNLAALVLGSGIALALVRYAPQQTAAMALWAAPALAAMALLGPDVDGARRWIGGGGVLLHAAMLAGPAWCVAAACRPGGGVLPVSAAAFAVVLALQPDFAAALALTLACAAIAAARRDRYAAIALAAALAGAVWAGVNTAGPAPVPFVEGVLVQSFAASTVAGIALVIASLAAIAAPALAAPDRRSLAMAAWQAGLLAASLLGPYPTPLTGYGAAAIIGYALGLALLRGDRHGLSATDR